MTDMHPIEPPQPVTVVTQDAATGTVQAIKHGDYALRGDREWIRRHMDWALRHGRAVIVAPRDAPADTQGTAMPATPIKESLHAA